MSEHLLYYPQADGFNTPLDVARSMALNATLGTFINEFEGRNLETPNVSRKDKITTWEQYAVHFADFARDSLPAEIGSKELLRHPSIPSVSKRLCTVALSLFESETAVRSSSYATALDCELGDVLQLTELDAMKFKRKISQSWHELQSYDTQRDPNTLAQIASAILLTTTVRKLEQEEIILRSEVE